MRKMPSDHAGPDLSISLDLDPYAPRAARHHLAQVDGLSPDVRDAAVLLTSELMTRAVKQCRPASGEGVELRVWMRAHVVRVELRAPGKLLSLPLKRDAPDYDVLLLRHVADRWSIETAQYPACMWFEIGRHRAQDPEPKRSDRVRWRGMPSSLDSPRMAQSEDDLFGDEHVRVYRETAGERGYHWRGATILLLTSEGRISGESRTTPLIHRTDGDRWVVVASKGGTPENPSWFKNLQANREATIQVKGENVPVRATAAEGEERSRLWSLMTEVWPAYDDYQARTDREIPVVVLARR
jgi:deazaflavin-dependent oxidoreductase (nitroreductase family)